MEITAVKGIVEVDRLKKAGNLIYENKCFIICFKPLAGIVIMEEL